MIVKIVGITLENIVPERYLAERFAARAREELPGELCAVKRKT